MNEWPVKPTKTDEHSWYRAIEKGLTLTVISADPDDAKCSECGATRTRFQCQVYPERTIKALCKDCCLKLAPRPGVWVRSEKALRDKWERDGKNPVKSALSTARWNAPGRGRKRSAADRGSEVTQC